MPPTMRDVANKANVSIKTVSRVVNNQGEISESTRLRVQEAINELGYRPNVVARSLVSGQTHSIGLIIPRITDPFFPEVVLGVESIAYQKQFRVFLCNTESQVQRELEYIDSLAGNRVDGIIICGSCLDEEKLAQTAQQIPISISAACTPNHAAIIHIQVEEGMRMITSHLIKLGHRHIGYISDIELDKRKPRLGAFRKTLNDHHLPDDAIEDCAVDNVINEGRQLALKLLYRKPELTAIVCNGDPLAIGAIYACQERGFRVPEDIAITGFDDIDLATLAHPFLTTIRVPRRKLGEILAELLFTQLNSEERHQNVVELPVELIIRESCGAEILGLNC
jgi:LacI family repressor for deo operon, udp, cdd, tsx, nupC, and nupG